MRIGIFGGAFNPPHIGHVNAVKAAAERQNLEMLIVVPTGIPPHKPLPQCTPDPGIRLQMTKNAFSDVPNTIISELEIYSLDNNYTIDTISAIQKEFPGADLHLLIGTDMYDTLDTWKDSKALIELVRIIVLSRETINISSTELRDMFPERKGFEYVCPATYALIIKHRLYGAKPDWDWLRKSAHLMLDPDRIAHVDACEAEALRLAMHWKVDIDDAREAAILHDITKKLDFNENTCIIAEHGIDIGDYGENEAKLLHSITGAAIAQSVFGVSRPVADAIKAHTTGSLEMSTLAKIIYLADYIEETRDFPGVDTLRRLAYENLDAAMIMGLEMTINDLHERGIAPHAKTYNVLRALKGELA